MVYIICMLFCLSAASNALPADSPPAISEFYASDKQKKRAEKVNKLSLRLEFKISKKLYGKYSVKQSNLNHCDS